MEPNNTIEIIKQLSASQMIRGADASVFSALNLGDDEEWHSDLLAWFLNPKGPLTKGWLLQSIFDHLGYEMPNGNPLIKRERQIDSSRPDILIEWASFKLLIENKTKSTEHTDQCRKYLKAFKINDREDGLLIFLSPLQKPWPRSIPKGDQRTYGMSYRTLVMLMKQGLEKETNEKASTYISDYLSEVSKLTGELTIREHEPKISESTRIINSAWSSIMELKSQASEECTAYIEWTLSLALKEVNKLGIGQWVAHSPFDQAVLFSRKDCSFGGHFLGIAYSPERKLGTRLMSEYAHLVGIRMYALKGKEVSEDQFRGMVRDALYQNWDEETIASLGLNPKASKTIKLNQTMWPIYKTVSFNNPENWEVWSIKLCKTIANFISVFNPVIVEVAERIKNQARNKGD